MNLITLPPSHHNAKSKKSPGFTLIELSIILVIIGLLVGGVLVGRDLIASSQLRAQISQLEQLQTAANAFRLKYGYLPGDLPVADANALSFTTVFNTISVYNSAYQGNGVMDGRQYPWQLNSSTGKANGFFNQLGKVGLISGEYALFVGTTPNITGAAIANYMPRSKIGGDSSYVFVYQGGPCTGWGKCNNRLNYFTFGNFTTLYNDNNASGGMTSDAITPAQAYAIDLKVDDGFPQSGKVMAVGIYANYACFGSNGAGCWVGPHAIPYNTLKSAAVALSGASDTCYDNNNVAGATRQYSISQNAENNLTCSISIQFH